MASEGDMTRRNHTIYISGKTKLYSSRNIGETIVKERNVKTVNVFVQRESRCDWSIFKKGVLVLKYRGLILFI